MAAFSRYIIYADENGSPNLVADSKDFPIFVLNFLIVEKRVYTESVVPELQTLKFKYFGHDQIVLHERDIRKQVGPFSVLRTDAQLRRTFIEGLTRVIASRDIRFACAIIDKRSLAGSTDSLWSPYDIALGMCMEQAARHLVQYDKIGSDVHVVFEARGKKEDSLLELEFRRVASGDVKVSFGPAPISGFTWHPIFADKKTNSAGLQIADLAARPLGLSYLRPDQPNRAHAAMMLTSAAGGIKTYPP